MAIAIDGSTPARWTGTPNNGVDITSASFSPPAGSLLVLTIGADTDASADNLTLSVSDSVNGTTGWTNQVDRDESDGGGAQESHAAIWTLADAAGGSKTVSVRRTAGLGGTRRISCKLYVVTGQHATPVGNVGEGTTTTNNTTPTILTTTADDSYVFVSVSDWSQSGSPTSSDGVEDSADYSGAISVMSMYEAQGAAGSMSMNIDAGGSGGVEINWVGLEVKAAAAAAATAPPPFRTPTRFFRRSFK